MPVTKPVQSQAHLHLIYLPICLYSSCPEPLTPPPVQAPDVHQVGSTYYLYYAVSTAGSQNSDIGLATSQTMERDSWTDHGSLGIPRSEHYNLIDPNLLIVNFNTSDLYMTFGSFWDDIHQIRMLDPATPMPGAVPQQVAYTAEGAHPLEGSFQFWWPIQGVPYYYLFVSRGACCNEPPNLAPPGQEYQVIVCRSLQPTGPFVDRQGRDCREGGGELILASQGDVYAPGGEGVYYDPDLNSPVLYYHYGEFEQEDLGEWSGVLITE